MSETRTEAARHLEQVATELETAARHVRVAARHIQTGEIPRFAAHLLAAQGHVILATRTIEEIAVIHASKAVAE